MAPFGSYWSLSIPPRIINGHIIQACDKEDEGMKTNSGEIDDVNPTTGKSPGVGSEGEETDEEDERTR